MTIAVETDMNATRFFLPGMAALCLAIGTAHADPADPPTSAAPALPGSRIDFAPLPLQFYLHPGQKPVAVFTTPCAQMEKASNGFPPFVAFEQFMFEMIGKVNDSEVLPIRLEPVCI